MKQLNNEVHYWQQEVRSGKKNFTFYLKTLQILCSSRKIRNKKEVKKERKID
jgi:hypothetical protein